MGGVAAGVKGGWKRNVFGLLTNLEGMKFRVACYANDSEANPSC